MEKEKYYITTTLPNVNAKPHMGHALEFVQADVIARYHTSLNKEVFFNTGTDEHGQKIYEKALEEKKYPQAYCDEYAEKFKVILNKLTIFPNIHFIRTTDSHHISAAQEFWDRCKKNGDIYKKVYAVKYCVGCELEKTDSELNDEGKCSVHPNLLLQHIEEENYFFRFSKYQKPLLDLYTRYSDFVVPTHRLTEIRNFVESGLQDFSISRLKSKMPWGIPVPGDEDHVMYVWFDALINYISTLGWPQNIGNFEEFWGASDTPRAVQIAGKDNLRQQSAMWQAMLLSAGLPPSRQIIIHGFITSGGQKMSKSLGNVIDPLALVEEYGTDALRYYLLREISPFEDGDFTIEKFRESYNAHLANGLGNLVSRVITLARNNNIYLTEELLRKEKDVFIEQYNKSLESYEFKKAMDVIWSIIEEANLFITQTEPFKTIKTDPEKAQKDILRLLSDIEIIGRLLSPLLPCTSTHILELVRNKDSALTSLFPRLG